MIRSRALRHRILLVGAMVVGAQLAVAAPSVGAPTDGGTAVDVQPAPAVPAWPEADRGFYEPPADVVAAAEPGEIIAAREVRLANLSVLPVNVDAWQLSYRSNNSRDEAIPAVATVIKPRGTIDGVRNLLSLQPAEDSLGQYCAASYALQQWSVPAPLTGQVVAPLQFLEAQAALAQGWAVVMPDHQGPNAAYAAGPLAGRITLDGIRAAENFDPLELSGRQTPVGLMGYSGGAIATGHAAELHESYAPDLNIVGAAEGGIPADLGALVDLAGNNLGAGIVLGGVFGVSRDYPELAEYLDTHLNPLGKQLLAAKGNLCVSYQSALLPFANLRGLFDSPSGDPLRDPVVESVLDRTRMGHRVPDVPMFMYQANPDWLVPVGPVDRLVDTYCQDPDARVTYIRDHASEHLSLEPVAAASALMWLRDRFDGVPAGAGCATHDVGSMALDEKTWPVWSSIVGDTLASLLGQPIGT
ncbi:lipase family protein [Rhodococcus koreensis]|uniref:Triacylglycerol lipase n=1 Tax=Rhodococcus koreensis TaxID=99653 RepID=A0A1H4SUW4_9NOCA|nr:lipase family protein [Rhodococcus koreensis]SEC47937.1 triacylglycerol lipase [Rhodococcus koreensis]